MSNFSILLIDDESAQLQSLDRFLTRRGFQVFATSNGPEGYEIAKSNTIDLVLTDYRMPEWSGAEVLEHIKQLNPDIEVVVITAFGSVEDAVNLMKAGAYDYLNKPIDLDELESLIERVREKRQLVRENRQLKEQLREKFKFESIISQSGEMEDVLNTAARVANSRATVLIRGESGTGKELIARAIHVASPRQDKPFVVINIAALPENLLESELFGHEKGAFTGASEKRIGRFEQANSGTLFIDEIGEIPLPVQVKLLRAIQFGQIERLGSNQSVDVDVRIVGATHRDLEEMIEQGDFREDLYFRMNVVSIQVPPLRKRKTDIPLLVDHFIEKYANENQKKVHSITRDALDELMKYNFPGNVRELQNIIERAVVMSRTEQITEQDLPGSLRLPQRKNSHDPRNLTSSYEEKMQAYEKAMITEALEQSDGNQSAAARLLGITERHIRSRMERLGLK